MVLNRKEAADQEKLKEVQSYREAFDHYDWNKNGTIPIKVKRRLRSKVVSLGKMFVNDILEPDSYPVRSFKS